MYLIFISMYFIKKTEQLILGRYRNKSKAFTIVARRYSEIDTRDRLHTASHVTCIGQCTGGHALVHVDKREQE